jgi:drug/metabolite transporter (DMT)-like permease
MYLLHNVDFTLMMKRLFWNAISINCFLSSLKYVPISIANALLNTTPVLTFFVEAAYYKVISNELRNQSTL